MHPPSSRTRLDRKSALQLLAAIAIGIIASQLLQYTAPVGENVGGKSAAQAIMLDHTSPTSEVAGADVTLVAFSDYQCPACKASYPAMTSAVSKDGHTRVVYKDLPIFGPRSEHAARVAIAAGFQGIYPAVHDTLMRSGNLGEAQLRTAIEHAGGNWEQVEHDLVSRAAEIDEQLGRNRREALSFGIAGTPAYLIGGTLVRGAINERQFSRVIRRARASG